MDIAVIRMKLMDLILKDPNSLWDTVRLLGKSGQPHIRWDRDGDLTAQNETDKNLINLCIVYILLANT
jgi:hypothetical protein